MNTHRGAFRLFQFAGVNVFLHWTWFLVAIFEINGRSRAYKSPVFNVVEYLGLFLIVLLHEYGHALACKQVGGKADQIMLWPFGGVAYVQPPQRPGATLWSIAAGPLVNVVLIPIFLLLGYLSRSLGVPQTNPDVHALLRAVYWINVALLVFNLLPIYPLDGGQILRSMLWFMFGRARSLTITTAFGFVGVAGLIYLALKIHSTWFVIIAVFILINCWGGWQHARALEKVQKLPRRLGYVCPTCNMSPPIGNFWKCSTCGSGFDTFESQAKCPHCGTVFPQTMCLDCRSPHPFAEWAKGTVSLTVGEKA